MNSLIETLTHVIIEELSRFGVEKAILEDKRAIFKLVRLSD